LHITVACYFSTPNLVYTLILKAQTLNLTLFLKARALNLALFLKAQALNLALFLKAQALNLALLSKVQALNLELTPFIYPIFKHKPSKVSKNIKPTNNLINKELRNPDSLSSIEIRRSGVKSLSGSLSKKIYFVCYCLHFISFFGRNKYFEKSHSFTCLIKGTAIERALWGASIFLTRNRPGL